jgi:hypothetical protein
MDAIEDFAFRRDLNRNLMATFGTAMVARSTVANPRWIV